MPLVLTVTNTGGEPVTLYLMGRTPTADFQISDAQGRAVCSRLRGQTMMAALRLYPLDSGKQIVLRHTWNGRDDSGDPVAPGDYVIRAVLLTDSPGGLAAAPSPIRITDA